jgi:hypothetical protein
LLWRRRRRRSGWFRFGPCRPEEGITAGTIPICGQYIEALKAADQCDISRLVELHDRYAMRE